MISGTKQFQTRNSFILDMAEVGDDEDDKDDEDDEEGYGGGTSVGSKVLRLVGPSATQKLAATFDDMATWFEHNPTMCTSKFYVPRRSSQDSENPILKAPEVRMYLLHVQSRFNF